jgi:GNT-I family
MAVVFTVSCQRRDYLDRALRSWKRARGAGSVHMALSLEHYLPFRKGEAELAVRERAFDGFEGQLAQLFPHAVTYRNATRLGCLRNTRRAVELGFATGANFVVCAEEDVEVADDVLEYFEWASTRNRNDRDILAVCAHSVASQGTPADVVRAPWFTPLVWGTWQDRWTEAMVPVWHPVEGLPQGWDYQIRKLAESSGRQCIYPALSRAQHFGRVSTMTAGSPVTGTNYFHDRSQSRSFRPHYDSQHHYTECVMAVEYY